MTAFSLWVPFDFNTKPPLEYADRFLDTLSLAFDPIRIADVRPGLAWAFAGRKGAEDQHPGQALDEERGAALTVFGPVFEVSGQSTAGQSRDQIAVQILALYDGKSDQWLQSLRSHAVFVLIDRKCGHAIVARDQMGSQPLYWRAGKGGVGLGNTARSLITMDGQRSGANRGRIAQFLVEDVSVSDACGTTETYFNDVSRVLPGHLLQITENSVEQRAYFDIATYFAEDKFTNPDPAAYRALLAEVIATQSTNPDTTGVTLSGGLDSPAIALLLSQHVGPDTALNTISLGNLGQGADESENVRSVLDDIRANPRWVIPDEKAIFDVMRKTHSQLEAPLFSPSPAVFMLLKQSVADAGMHQVFGGLGADEALGGLNMGFLRDLLVRGQLATFWSEVTAASKVNAMRQDLSRFGVFREHVHDPFRSMRPPPKPPAWVDPGLAQEFNLRGGRPVRPRIARLDCFDGRNAAILIRTFTQSFLHYEAQLGIAWGVENRFPYLDPRIISYAARLPWHEKFSQGLYKHHHRKAFDGLFPEKIAMQQKKSLIPAVHDHWLRVAAQEPVRDIVESGGAWTNYLDAKTVRQEYRTYVASTDEIERNRLRRSTWRAVTIELFHQSMQ
ncbi:asparagine synthase [Sulfitobacter sp. W027]|uniref:asparagine synthase-related protein n=1 Tax=Sulfitobacter sp. W027 TaxID=2867025 RepID=UPI0021A5C2E0|nr:asparagine synthetase B family protein [Sulfitobacter sp. W027]UWR32282.1 asparagine synthase [Sulfitobacter sp. W027]